MNRNPAAFDMLKKSCELIKSVVKGTSQDQFKTADLIYTLKTLDFGALESSNLTCRKMAAVLGGLMIQSLARTMASSKDANCAIENNVAGVLQEILGQGLKGPFVLKDTFLYLTFEENVTEQKHQEMIKALRRQQVCKKKDMIFSYMIERSSDSQPLAINLTKDRLFEILNNPRLLDCLPDPATTLISIDLGELTKTHLDLLNFRSVNKANWVKFSDINLNERSYKQWRLRLQSTSLLAINDVLKVQYSVETVDTPVQKEYQAEDISDAEFSCLLEWPKIRNQNNSPMSSYQEDMSKDFNKNDTNGQTKFIVVRKRALSTHAALPHLPQNNFSLHKMSVSDIPIKVGDHFSQGSETNLNTSVISSTSIDIKPSRSVEVRRKKLSSSPDIRIRQSNFLIKSTQSIDTNSSAKVRTRTSFDSISDKISLLDCSTRADSVNSASRKTPSIEDESKLSTFAGAQRRFMSISDNIADTDGKSSELAFANPRKNSDNHKGFFLLRKSNKP